MSIVFNKEILEETDTTDSNDSDDGLYLAANVAVIEQVSEEMDTTQVPAVLNAGIQALSESISYACDGAFCDINWVLYAW